MILPKVFGFINSSSPEWYNSIGIAEDGTILASHASSSVGWARADIGSLNKKDVYLKHYPQGFEFDFVYPEEVHTHAGLQAAFHRLRVRVAKEKNLLEAEAELKVDF